MMNENVNAGNVHNDEIAALRTMFGDYKNKQSKTGTSISREELLSKYFVPRNNREIFRALPPLPGRKPIEEAFFHVVPTITSGGKIKRNTVIYCPAHNDPKTPKLDENGNPVLDKNGKPIMVHAPCPLCAKYNNMIKQQDRSIIGKKVEEMNDAEKAIKARNDKIFNDAKDWQARKFYIIKGIDKGAIKDGPKFWRFKHNFKNNGTLNKLLPMMEQFLNKHNIPFYDPHNGGDIEITQTDVVLNNKTYKEIIGISLEKCPIHTDSVLVNSWLSDDTTWRDVFKPKKAPNITPFEFLEMVAEGTNPYWDDTDANNKRWIFPNRPDLEAKANTRTRNLDADEEKEIELASDLVNTPQVFGQQYNPTVTNVPTQTPVENVVVQSPPVNEPTTTIPTPPAPVVPKQPESYIQTLEDESTDDYNGGDAESDDYEDLPF